MTDEINDAELAQPKVIGNLIFVGHAVLWLSVITAFLLFVYAFQCIDNCEYQFIRVIRYDVQPGLIPLAFALLVGGWIQQQFIHGFSVGLDQLFEIRKNTSN